jgi:anthranilate synthase/aminodeoxychorismate synthase-like glutamine amidotransferase
MVKLLILDNFDSFTYNLVELIRKTAMAEYRIITPNDYEKGLSWDFDKILMSPGPGLASEYPLMHSLLSSYASQKSILGICLGHQAIVEFFGGTLYNLEKIIHGKESRLRILKKDILFEGVKNQCCIALYHSWAVCRKTFPDCLEICAESDEGLIMAVAHKRYPVRGVQFHPESFITTEGEKMIRNWLQS